MDPADIDPILALSPVVPVLVVDVPECAGPLAQALVAGGLRVLEVTLRTPAALDVIRAMAQVPGAVVGAGTVLDPQQLEAAQAAGARFIVSPGFTPALGQAATRAGLPLLPGAVTPSEVMAARAAGRTRLKFFPAEAIGGLAVLRAYAAVFPEVRFCPTGGIDADKAAAYLALPNVACVGGSWLAPPATVAAGQWAEITRLARAAAGLRG